MHEGTKRFIEVSGDFFETKGRPPDCIRPVERLFEQINGEPATDNTYSMEE